MGEKLEKPKVLISTLCNFHFLHMPFYDASLHIHMNHAINFPTSSWNKKIVVRKIASLDNFIIVFDLI